MIEFWCIEGMPTNLIPYDGPFVRLVVLPETDISTGFLGSSSLRPARIR